MWLVQLRDRTFYFINFDLNSHIRIMATILDMTTLDSYLPWEQWVHNGTHSCFLIPFIPCWKEIGVFEKMADLQMWGREGIRWAWNISMLPEGKVVLKKMMGGAYQKTQKLVWRGCHWPNLGLFEHLRTVMNHWEKETMHPYCWQLNW